LEGTEAGDFGVGLGLAAKIAAVNPKTTVSRRAMYFTGALRLDTSWSLGFQRIGSWRHSKDKEPAT
jgi:hypothetical protein